MLLWIDGFDAYGTSIGSAPSPTGIVGRQYTVNNENYMDIDNGRLEGQSLKLLYSSTYIRTPAINDNATIIVGFAFKLETSLNWAGPMLKLYDDTTLNMSLTPTSAGEIEVRRGSTLLDTTSGLGLELDEWYWLEFKTVIDNSSGSYELKLGEASVLSDSGIDTQEGSNAYCDKITFLGSGISTGPTVIVDDLYICNGAGSANNDFLGNVKVQTIFPNGAGNTTQFTPSAGSNYDCVDEEVADDDTTYVEADTTDYKDTYAYENIIAGTANIKGIQINTLCRETDASSFSLKTVIRSGSTDYDDSSQAINTTDYVFKRRVEETDPDTTSAWTESGINSAEFGIKVG